MLVDKKNQYQIQLNNKLNLNKKDKHKALISEEEIKKMVLKNRFLHYHRKEQVKV
jgi:hypothetical protein